MVSYQDVSSTLSDSPKLELVVMTCPAFSPTQRWSLNLVMQCLSQHYRYYFYSTYVHTYFVFFLYSKNSPAYT